ncbi:DUF6301 family protein [Streptomyces sp. NPDC018031]|uniref:DUF6301 family protein n=1 Tax=Streptomyces sp. NPDC018031 TaxID=3365033 RepID=UPI0037AD578E
MQHLKSNQVANLAMRLDSHEWSWRIDQLQDLLAAADLRPLEPLDRPTVSIEFPELPGVEGFVTNIPEESLVLQISISLTEFMDESDSASLAILDDLYLRHEDALVSIFGPPEKGPGKVAAWVRGDEILMLRHLDFTLELASESRSSRRIQEGG